MFFEISLFTISLLASLIIIYVRRKGGDAHEQGKHATFAFLDDFTDGVFLGIGLFELGPHAVEDSIDKNTTIIAILCGVLLMLLIGFLYRRYVTSKEHIHDGGCCAYDVGPSVWMVSPILIILGVHSFFEGIALGIVNEPIKQWLLYGSIALHKGLESMAFANASLGAFSVRWLSYTLIVLFAMLTPLGVFTGSQIMHYHPHHDTLTVALNVISASMFIYMGLSCVLASTHEALMKTIRPSLLGLCLVYAASLYSHHDSSDHDHGSHTHVLTQAIS